MQDTDDLPRAKRKHLNVVLALSVVLVAMGLSLWPIVRAPIEPPAPPLTVNDVSQLNPIQVSAVITPTTTLEIIDAVRDHAGPISIGGARHSMGGQIATEGALHIDMRQFNKIRVFSPAARTITVQAGTTWRQIQEAIDPANLSVTVMQSYANFTVGGSLSVNGHGRYVGLGPLVRSVKSLSVILADGSLVDASPNEHSEIFYGVIGGYGGLGVITEATLTLSENVRVKRHSDVMPVTAYHHYFFNRIRGQPGPLFHNGNIFPDDFGTVRAVTYSSTEEPVTVSDRLRRNDRSYGLNRLAFWIQTEWPFGKWIERRVIDPIYFAGEPVTWRNYEASYDVAELEPASRRTTTYLLQEYFVPVERFDEFVPKMREVLQQIPQRAP
jgi:FAD/FMN-containing dehydrogenase